MHARGDAEAHTQVLASVALAVVDEAFAAAAPFNSWHKYCSHVGVDLCFETHLGHNVLQRFLLRQWLRLGVELSWCHSWLRRERVELFGGRREFSWSLLRMLQEAHSWLEAHTKQRHVRANIVVRSEGERVVGFVICRFYHSD